MPIENGITQSVTDMRGETSLQEPIESGWNLVCLVSLVFLLRIPGRVLTLARALLESKWSCSRTRYILMTSSSSAAD
jgi:hypothetical protein